MEIAALIVVMLFVGLLLGFVGAGGSGFMIAVLISPLFHYPIHTAMGTAIAAMAFTSLSGMISQLRAKNTDVAGGLTAGLTGAAASWCGSAAALAISPDAIRWLTAGMLLLSAGALWLRMAAAGRAGADRERVRRPFAAAALVGVVTGFFTGAFGIGSTPFIQLGLMLLVGLDLRKAAGTSMLVILPVSAAGAAGYWQAGSLDFGLLATVLAGSMTGAFIGAKFTRYAPAALLKTGMVGTPILAAGLLFI